MKCGDELYNPKLILTLGGAISSVCLAIIFSFFYFFKIPNLRRHPTNIIIHKCWFELMFISQYIWMAFVPDSFFWQTITDDSKNCVVNPNIWPLAWLTEFSLLGGELWFGVLSLDIHISLTNPFTSHKMNKIYYRLGVFSISFIMATILVSIVPIQYGLSTDPMIWVHDQDEVAWTKYAMFYSFMVVIYVYCGYIALHARYQIHKGLEETLERRKYSVSKQTRYVIGYFTFWTLVFVFQAIIFAKTDLNMNTITSDQQTTFRTMSAFLLASRGIWSLTIFLVSNKNEITLYFEKKKSQLSDNKNSQKVIDPSDSNADPQALDSLKKEPPTVEEEELVQLNIALQKEIVVFTALGIQKAIKEYVDSEQELSPRDEQEASTYQSHSNNLSFFHSKMQGEALSFNFGHQQSLSHIHSNQFFGSYRGPYDNPMHRDNSSRLDESTIRLSLLLKDPLMEVPVDIEQPRSKALKARYLKEENHFPLKLPSTNQSPPPNSPTDPIAPSDSKSQNLSRSHRKNSVDTLLSSLGSTIINNLDAIKRRIIPLRSNFVFTDFRPKVFAKIRELSNISNEDYLRSFQSTTMPKFTEGRSGAFVYYSSDYKYIVKTLSRSEFEKLLSIIYDFQLYLEKEIALSNKPLINRYFGAHRIVMYDIPIFFVVMENICPVVDEKYDLKGSWINRHGSKKAKDPQLSRPKKAIISSPIKKDTHPHQQLPIESPGQTQETENFNDKLNDPALQNPPHFNSKATLFLDNDLQNCFLMRKETAKLIAKQIARDTKFLEKYNLMDYSLLVGVKRQCFQILDSIPEESEELKELNEENLRVPNLNPFRQDPDGAFLAYAVEGQSLFYIGIIDILQEWNWKKWYERMFKKYVLQKDGNGISSAEPGFYRRRFIKRAVVDVFQDVEMEDIELDDNEFFTTHAAANRVFERELASSSDSVLFDSMKNAPRSINSRPNSISSQISGVSLRTGSEDSKASSHAIKDEITNRESENLHIKRASSMYNRESVIRDSVISVHSATPNQC